jgi:hypothetical protein
MPNMPLSEIGTVSDLGTITIGILQFNARFWIILNIRIVLLNIQGYAQTVLRETIPVRCFVKHQLHIQIKLMVVNKSMRWVPCRLGTARVTPVNDGGGRHLCSKCRCT